MPNKPKPWRAARRANRRDGTGRATLTERRVVGAPAPRARLVLAICLGLAATAAPAAAQLTRSDTASVLLEAARQFEVEGREDVARALYERISRRYGDTAAGGSAADRLARFLPAPPTRTGRVELQVWGTLYGSFLGVAVPGAFGADDPTPYGVGLLLGAPAGFMLGRTLTRTRSLTEGQVRAITLGGTWGAWQGAGWQQVLEIGLGEDCFVFEGVRYCEEEDGTEETFAALIVGSLAGLGTGIALSHRPITPAVATAANLGALWGTWFGLAGGVLANLEDDDLLAATLIGGNAGLLATALLAPGWDISRNRVRLISLAGLIGGLAGGGIDLIVQPEDDRVAVGIPLAASVAGLAVGVAVTRGFDGPQADADDVSTGGALFALGEGGWRAGVPLPYPTSTIRAGPAGYERRRDLRVLLLRAAF